MWLQLAIYLPFTFVASLLLLQPVKGAVVGFQWALRMHGFDENAPRRHSAGLAKPRTNKSTKWGWNERSRDRRNKKEKKPITIPISGPRTQPR